MILASTDPGDLVLDPFCGCSTTLLAAENAGRQWIGIDRDENAEQMVKGQLGKPATSQTPEFWRSKVIIRKDIPKRTDDGESKHYRKHKIGNTKHISTKNKTAIVPVAASVGTRLFAKSTIKRQKAEAGRG